MSILPSLRRALLPIPSSSQLSCRSLSHCSSRLAAAAAASSSPSPKVFVRRSPVAVRSKPASSPVSSSTRIPSSSTPTPPAARSNDYDDDFDIGPPPELNGIDDYAHLSPPPSASAPSSIPTPTSFKAPASFSSSTSAAAGTPAPGEQPTPSPPLRTFPNDSYHPLPLASSNTGTNPLGEAPAGNDWSVSFSGLSERPFEKEVRDALLRPLGKDDVEIKPDGLLYLPEIKYRRTLNAAFGPGGWGLAPRGETNVGPRIVSREWALICLGRLVSIARGEQEYFDPSGVPTATEACKSNALMRCCKDLGIASELWDPSFIRDFKAKYCVEVWVEHATQKKKRKQWRKKDAAKFDYPYKETGLVN